MVSIPPVFPTGHSFSATEKNDNNSSSTGDGEDKNNDALPLSGGEEKRPDDDDNSDRSSKVVTAQEARVRRMRARFLDMKSLIDEEPAGPSSPTAASPRGELGYGLDALKLEDDIASATPVKGMCNLASLLVSIDFLLRCCPPRI